MAFDRQYAPQRLRRNVTRRETITGQQLEDFGTALPRNAAEGIRRRPVMSGRLSNDNLQSFLNIHTTDTVSMQDADVKFPVKAAVTVAIVLRGRVCGHSMMFRLIWMHGINQWGLFGPYRNRLCCIGNSNRVTMSAK